MDSAVVIQLVRCQHQLDTELSFLSALSYFSSSVCFNFTYAAKTWHVGVWSYTKTYETVSHLTLST
jgi:hypothetical protein